MNPNNINDNLIKENYAYIKKWADSIPVTAAGYKNFGEIWDVVFEKKQAVDLFKEIHSLYPTGLDADVKAMNQGNELIIYFIKVIERDTQKVIYDAGNSFNSAQQRLDNKKQFWKEKYPENKYSVKGPRLAPPVESVSSHGQLLFRMLVQAMNIVVSARPASHHSRVQAA